jgi:thioredoxin reductase (NADPH)
MATIRDRYDLIVVGSGPAGLSGAINAESEGIDTLVLDAGDRPGGQAGTSTCIENYPGFPGGVTGQRLMSSMVDQALGFTTEFLAPVQAEGITPTGEGYAVTDDRDTFLGSAVLLGTGVQYRRLKVPNLAAYLGRGVHYGSPRLSEEYEGKELLVVGGANSAGQAAMHLSKFTECAVHMVVRGQGLSVGMSEYLSDRIDQTPNVQVHTETEVVGVDGDGRLKEVMLKHGDRVNRVPADELFILIGAQPKTTWLPDAITTDKIGFVQTGGDIPAEARDAFYEATGRQPFAHETGMPGIFVAGDVRFGTTKRVAAAVGDGATAIPELHRYLQP